MTHPLGGEDFFILEAGEYLARLSTLASGPSTPNGQEIVRFARALRGSAQMAAQLPIARAAGAFEQLLREVRDGHLAWSPEVAAMARRTIDDLRALTERVKRWSPEDSATVERMTAELEALKSGTATAPARPAPSTETGLRAFLAREAAAIGSVLAQAAHALRGGVAQSEPADAVLRRMHSLQGMAALSDFPPFPDLLEGVERLCRSITLQEIGRVEGASHLDAGADALGRAARDIADRGRLDPEAAELQSFARRLLAPALSEIPVVPIESLFPDGEDGVVTRGATPRATSALLSAAAVVSRGERLFQSADDLASAAGAVVRDLRLHRLLGELSGLSSGLPPGLDVAVESFAVAARAAVARGDAALDRAGFAETLRAAGERLRGFTDLSEPMRLATAFDEATRALDSLGGQPGAAVPETPEVGAQPGTAAHEAPEAPVVPIESLAPAEPELPIVPIESLLYEEPAAAPTPAVATPVVAPAPAGRIEGWDLAASFSRYEALLSGSRQPPAPAVAAAAAEVVVDIAELLYRGPRALAEADRVRALIRSALSAGQPAAVTEPLVEELLDLVELAAAG